MASELEIIKPHKKETFNMFKGFDFIDTISKDEPKKLECSLSEFTRSIHKACVFPDEFKADYIDKVAIKLFDWISDDEVYQKYDTSFIGEECEYEEVEDRFFEEEN